MTKAGQAQDGGSQGAPSASKVAAKRVDTKGVRRVNFPKYDSPILATTFFHCCLRVPLLLRRVARTNGGGCDGPARR